VSNLPTPSRMGRRAILGTLAAAAVGTPIAIAQPWAGAATGSSGPGTAPKATPTPTSGTALWSPNPATDGLKAFEGIEADRAGLHPGRKYVYIEGDHYRFDIFKDDRDSTGGGDRQRTESKGMVAAGKTLAMHNNQTWKITYEMFMPSTLHGTSKFTHIFQLKTPATNDGPWVTLDLGRSGSKETFRARAYLSSGPDIASTDLAPLREKWITIEWTFTFGPKGSAQFVCRGGTGASAPIVTQGKRTGVNIPDEGDRVRPKWGIYRSVQSASSDIIDTHLLFRNYKAYRLA
jgi:hypothetical protein